jgi:hypothetical protein
MSHLSGQSGGIMRRALLQQGQLGEVRLPKLGARVVMQALDAATRWDRELKASSRLNNFREDARRLVAYRLLREARRRHPRQWVGSAEFFDLTGRNGDALREALALAGAKWGGIRLSCLLVNEETRLEDAKGPLYFANYPWAPWRMTSWTDRGVNLTVVFVPVGFGDHESLVADHDETSGIAREKLAGRANLILFLVARAYSYFWACRAPRRASRLHKKWGLRWETSLEQYASRLLDVMREP